jgi:FdhD protein
MGRVTARVATERLDVAAGRRTRRPDTLAVEEPLEVRVGGEAVVVTMRTPGHDVDLALGFLLTEGLLGTADDVATARHCADPGEDGLPTYNVIELVLRPGVPAPDLQGRRTFGMTSACGVCGTASIDAVRRRSAHDVAADDVRVAAQVLAGLPDRLREEQRTFQRTGGLHAAGLFTSDGEPVVVREDVGRHNAVDKVLGWAARERGWPLRGTVLLVSGRASFELAQKAWAAGVPVLAAVSAPSSLAAQLAQEAGLTLVGFLRGPTMNVYSRPDRVVDGAAPGQPSASLCTTEVSGPG